MAEAAADDRAAPSPPCRRSLSPPPLPLFAQNVSWKKVPALSFGPAENTHVTKHKMVMKRFPVSIRKQQWSKIDKEKLVKGAKQQYQEMQLLNSVNIESVLDGSINSELMPVAVNCDLEFTPEKIRSFLPLVNWDRLASLYLPGRRGTQCESRLLLAPSLIQNYGRESVFYLFGLLGVIWCLAFEFVEEAESPFSGVKFSV